MGGSGGSGGDKHDAHPAHAGGGRLTLRGCCARLLPCIVDSPAERARTLAAQALDRAKRQSGRAFSKANSGLSRLLATLLAPIAAFTAYYSGVYAWRSGIATSADAAQRTCLWTAELEIVTPLVGYALRNALFYSEPRWVAMNLAAANARLDVVRRVSTGVAYGSSELGLSSSLGTSPTAYSILLTNGCVRNDLDPALCSQYINRTCAYFYDYDYCYKPPDNVDPNYRVFYYGVVGTGLLPALQTYVLKVQAVIDRRMIDLKAAQANGTGSKLPVVDPLVGLGAVMTPEDYDAIDKMTDEFLPAGLHALSAATQETSVSLLDSFRSQDALAVALSIVAVVLFYYALYLPVIFSLNAQTKRVRFLLLLVPEDVAKQTPAIVAAAKKLMETAL
jgi:hypothetical protein